METVGSSCLWSYVPTTGAIARRRNKEIRQEPALQVDSYIDLATRIAELQFLNRDIVLLFRGQQVDHLNDDGNTSLKPTLFRPLPPDTDPPNRTILEQRFDILKRAELELTLHWNNRFGDSKRINRYRILRWTILQHYGVCPTPLLDVTQSLRIAASVASTDTRTEAFVFVLGVPSIAGAITASADAGLQIVRLSSVCPPQAIRPHIQEGYLLGEYPEIAGFEQKVPYTHLEIDFGRRLVAKFVFNPQLFWPNSPNFPPIPKEALYPSFGEDPFRSLADHVKHAAGLI